MSFSGEYRLFCPSGMEAVLLGAGASLARICVPDRNGAFANVALSPLAPDDPTFAGAVLALCSSRAAGELSHIPALCRYVELSGDKRFNDLFADNMAFYEEDF